MQKNWQVALDKGAALSKIKDYKGAETEFQKALLLARNLPSISKSQTLTKLSLLCKKQEDFARALQYAEEALKILQDDKSSETWALAEANLNVAERLNDRGEFEKALEKANTGQELLAAALSENNPNIAEAWILQESILKKLHRDSEAAALAKKTSELQNGYMSRVQKKIKANWTPPVRPTSVIEARFHILGDGSVQDLKIYKPIGDKVSEEAALAAIKAAAPFETFRGGGKYNDLGISFEFNYNNWVTNKEDAAKQLAQTRAEIAKLTAAGAPASAIRSQRLGLAVLLKNSNDPKGAIEILTNLLGEDLSDKDSSFRLDALITRGLALYSINDLNGATADLGEAQKSPGFSNLDSRKRLAALEPYAKALYRQGKEAEAKPIYDQILTLKTRPQR